MAAAAAEYSPKIQKRTLKGHRNPVLCLAHSSERLSYYPKPGSSGSASSINQQSQEHQVQHPSLLLSGSEDGTARLWDLRTRKTALCMVIPIKDEEGDRSSAEVVSVAFHPSIAEDGHVSTPGSSLQHDCTVYASTANSVYGYDLRYHSTTSSAPIVKTPHFDFSPLLQCTDEINQLSFSFPKRNDGNVKYYLAAADDNGDANVTECLPHRYSYEQESSNENTTNNNQMKTFRHAEPQTMAITSNATFQPRTNNDSYLATRGTDCTVKLWDVSRPRRPTSTIHIKPAESENTTQLCNPPYVHSLSWSPSGRLLAAGVGDGSCAILRAEGRRLVEIGRLGSDEGGHGSAVAAVCFPGFGVCEKQQELSVQLPSKVRKSGEAEDRLMISTGNDGNIIFWDLGGNMVGSGALDPVVYLEKCLSPIETNEEGTPGKDVEDAAVDMGALDISNQKVGKTKGKKSKGKDLSKDHFPEELTPSPPRILFQIAHRQKPNWVTCSRASDSSLSTSLFVADTTNNISVYTLPL